MIRFRNPDPKLATLFPLDSSPSWRTNQDEPRKWHQFTDDQLRTLVDRRLGGGQGLIKIRRERLIWMLGLVEKRP